MTIQQKNQIKMLRLMIKNIQNPNQENTSQINKLQHTIMGYPTENEITEKPCKIKPSTIKILEKWKKKYYIKKWRETTNKRKMIAISKLLQKINKNYKSKPLNIEILQNDPCGYCYFIPTKTIILTGKASIISALHELGHHLYGHSETKACRWSVWLFKTIFEKEFSKLHFEGHMLKNKNNEIK